MQLIIRDLIYRSPLVFFSLFSWFKWEVNGFSRMRTGMLPFISLCMDVLISFTNIVVLIKGEMYLLEFILY